MKRSLLLSVSFIVFLTVPLLHAAEAAEPSDHGSKLQEILILNSYHPGYAWSDDEQAGIIDVFRAKDKKWLPVIEYLDLKRLPDGKHLIELKKLFRLKYQNKKFSLVIAMDNPALEFAINNQAELFRNAPIVFCGINNYTPSLLKGRSDVTGIAESLDIAGTIEVMLRQHSAAREIFVPHDYTVTGLAVRKELEALAPRFAKVRFRFTDPLTMEELLKELERLPKDSLVLEIGFLTDKSCRTFGVAETTKLFYEHSPVPIYSTFEQRLGFGIVGGKLLSARIHGTNAARVALRVLAGEKASAIPVIFESSSQFMFDYKVMKRFGIPLSALPEGSIVINKPVSFYAAHRVVIQTALGVIVFMAVVIALLTTIIIQRRRSVIALRASEAKYYDLYENAPDMHFSVDVKTATITECNNTLVEAFGYSREEILGRSIFEIYHPDGREESKRVFQQFVATGEVHNAERMIRRKDGGIIYVSLNASAVRDKEGKIILSRSVWRDITERKKIENALRESEERLRFHMDNSPMAVVEWNADFIVTRWTGAAEKIFGWSFEETIGKPIMELHLIYEEDIPIVQSVMQRLTDGKSKHIVSSNRNYTKKREVIHCEWYNSALHDSAGKMISVMSRVLDITARKKAEIRLDRLNDCFLQFRVSPDENINRLVAVCGELMNATCALYNRLGKDLLCSVGQWRTPAGFKPEDKPKGHICYDVIQQGGEHPLLVRNLQEGPYAGSDPNVLPYGLQTYLGMVVKWKQAAIGSLCVVYQTDIIPSNDDLQLMTIVASAIAVEEDRRRAEEALRESEARYRQLVEYAPAAIYEADLTTGRLLSVNEVLCEYSGYTRDELLALHPLDLMTEESQKLILQRMAGYAAGEPVPPDVEYKARSKSGREFWISTNAKYFYQAGLPVRATVVAHDITERKQAEEALRGAEENFRHSLDGSPLGVRIVTAEGDTLYANRAILDSYGYDNIDEFNATPIKRRYTPESYAEFRIRKEKRKRGDYNPSEYDISIVRKDGEVRHLQVFRKEILWNGEEQFQVIYQDITERKQAEEDLLVSREQMRALAGRLQEVREEERTHIAREIHDELGGALTGLKIDFSLLTKVALKIKNETVRESLLDGIQSMMKSIDTTMHAVRRISMELRPGILDDLGLVAALEWQLKDFDKRTGIQCEFFPPEGDISLDADLSTALFRIFQEALTNVVRHSEATEVSVRLHMDADSPILEVEDNGKGIEKKKILSSKSLGLLGMRERAQMLGGRLTVTGIPGRGTTVTVEIRPSEKRNKDQDQKGETG